MPLEIITQPSDSQTTKEYKTKIQKEKSEMHKCQQLNDKGKQLIGYIYI